MGSCCSQDSANTVEEHPAARGEQQRLNQAPTRQHGRSNSSNAHNWGAGQRLGSSNVGTPTAEQEEQRMQRLRAAEARQAEWDAKAGKRPAKRKSQTRSQRTPESRQSEPRTQPRAKPQSAVQQSCGNGTDASRGVASGGRREAARAAAEARAQQQYSGLSSAKSEELRLRREKDALIGKIEAHYAAAGEEAPFGLAAASLDALRRNLAHAKILKKR